MNTASLASSPMSTVALAIVGLLIIVAVVTAVLMHRRRVSMRLQRRFGAEYGRTVQALGGQSQAESELQKREARVAKLNLTPLAPAEAARFSQAWSQLQGRFVDSP